MLGGQVNHQNGRQPSTIPIRIFWNPVCILCLNNQKICIVSQDRRDRGIKAVRFENLTDAECDKSLPRGFATVILGINQKNTGNRQHLH